jgi:adenine-specific DNA-methyltransferase
MSREQKITGNIQPPNKDLEILKQNFSNCFDKSGNLDFEKFKKQLSKNEINFSKESYGMDWLGKSYARLLATDETTTLLKEDETFNQKEENKNSENLLIKGDNLEVLKHLSNAYYEKVKMIYIDPPYNTGSDGFVYADDRKFTVEELQELAGISEERAKQILDFTQSNSNSHSAWLTFMYPRLYIAKQLLKEDGVIFISIDDNEVAQLKLLMDEIFGEENFIKDLIVNTSEGGGQAKHVINGHEYLLVYAKNLNQFDNLKRPKDIRGKKITLNGELYWIQEDAIRKEFGKYGNLHYEEILEFKDETFKKKIDDGIENKEYLLIPKDYGLNIIGKLRKVSEDFSKFHSILNIGEIAKHLTANGIKEIESIFSVSKGNSPFSNPKPIDLLKRIVLSTTFKGNQNEIVLDFFAGSGTTADALMQLNAGDNGNRKFILAQLPELIDPKNNKMAYDFVKNKLKVKEPTIFEITKERLIRASKKIQEENKEKDLSKQDLGFKIFETMPIWKDYNFEAEELDLKQMQFFDENKLTKEDIKALLVTWKTYDGISLSQTIQETDLNGYTANYSNEKLYLMDKGFTTENLKALLEKIDSDKDFNPTAIIAFGYHFESKNLREISENIKSYVNKKSIDIDFITRY